MPASPSVEVGDNVVLVVKVNGKFRARNALVSKVLPVALTLFYVDDEGEHQCLIVRHCSLCTDLNREAWWATMNEVHRYLAAHA